MSTASQVIVSRRGNHHLAAETIRAALSNFTVGNHADGTSIPLRCRVVGAKQPDNAQGWIDSPGLAITLLSLDEKRVSEDLPQNTPTRTVPAATLACAQWRLYLKTANLFDSIDVQTQLMEYLRGHRNTGATVTASLTGQKSFLKTSGVPTPVRLTWGEFVQRPKMDAHEAYLDFEAEYELKDFPIDYVTLYELRIIMQHFPDENDLKELFTLGYVPA